MGKQIGQSFGNVLASYQSRLQGDTLLQLGDFGEHPWLEYLSYTYQWLATPDSMASLSNGSVVTEINQLPFKTECMDAVIAPFTLELFDYKINTLNEIDRILKPMGYAVFWGINPWGLWGLSARMRAHRYFGALPVRLRSAFFVKRKMLRRGYVESLWKSFYYIPPVNHKGLLKNVKYFDTLGKFIWPCPAAFYCLIFQKYQEDYLNLPSMEMEKKMFCHARMQESGMYSQQDVVI
ncbi:MAG: methyltransferase domain-containing protein [Legionella sp.]|nr:methyltransferase domain-containing protein [Legionella sp.]